MRKKIIAVALVIAAAALLVIGSSLAWLTSTENKVNAFLPGKVAISVQEEFQSGTEPTVGTPAVKKVAVKNDTGLGSNVNAFLRVKLVPVWRDADTNANRGLPVDNVQLNLASGSGWFLGSDGCYYYPDPVAPGGLTAELLSSVTIQSAPSPVYDNAYLEIQVLADGIQAEGDAASAVAEAWPAVKVQNGTLVEN